MPRTSRARQRKKGSWGGLSRHRKVLKREGDRDAGEGASERVVGETVGGETFF